MGLTGPAGTSGLDGWSHGITGSVRVYSSLPALQYIGTGVSAGAAVGVPGLPMTPAVGGGWTFIHR